jgi:hypothetical protein
MLDRLSRTWLLPVLMVVVVLAGVLLLPGGLPPGWDVFGMDTDVRSNLGASLLGGAVVGLLLIVMEVRVTAQAQRREQEAHVAELAQERDLLQSLIRDTVDEVVQGMVLHEVAALLGWAYESPFSYMYATSPTGRRPRDPSMPSYFHSDVEPTDVWSDIWETVSVMSSWELLELFGELLPVLAEQTEPGMQLLKEHYRSLDPADAVSADDELPAELQAQLDALGPHGVRTAPASALIADMVTTMTSRLSRVGDLDTVRLLWTARARLAAADNAEAQGAFTTATLRRLDALQALKPLAPVTCPVPSPFCTHGVELAEPALDLEPGVPDYGNIWSDEPTLVRWHGEVIELTELPWEEWVAFTWDLLRPLGPTPRIPGVLDHVFYRAMLVGLERRAGHQFGSRPYGEPVEFDEAHRRLRPAFAAFYSRDRRPLTKNTFYDWAPLAVAEWRRRFDKPPEPVVMPDWYREPLLPE